MIRPQNGALQEARPCTATLKWVVRGSGCSPSTVSARLSAEDVAHVLPEAGEPEFAGCQGMSRS